MRCVEDQADEVIDDDVYDGVSYLGPVPSNDVDDPHVFDAEPHAFMVQIGASRDPIKTHYHRVDQFQYVRSGSGRIVPHGIVAGSVHYTDAYTPYGPVAPGPEGLTYLTLRGTIDNGAYYMPESRADLKDRLATSVRPPRARRNLSVELASAGHAADWTDLVHDDDELRIATRDVAAGVVATTPVVGGGGAYVVVVSGSFDHGAERHATGSLIWLERGESTEVGGPDGGRLGLLQFPIPVR